MYYFVENLEHMVGIHPQVLGELTNGVDWKKIVGHKAFLELSEGKFSPGIGYIQNPFIVKISEGVVQLSGLIRHRVTYNAVVQFPVINEVVDATVCAVESCRIVFCFGGYIYGMIGYEEFPSEEEYIYREISSSSNACNREGERIPDKMFVSLQDSNKVIKNGSTVRLRIKKRTYGATGFWLFGTMRSKFLGLRVEKDKPAGSPLTLV